MAQKGGTGTLPRDRPLSEALRGWVQLLPVQVPYSWGEFPPLCRDLNLSWPAGKGAKVTFIVSGLRVHHALVTPRPGRSQQPPVRAPSAGLLPLTSNQVVPLAGSFQWLPRSQRMKSNAQAMIRAPRCGTTCSGVCSARVPGGHELCWKNHSPCT